MKNRFILTVFALLLFVGYGFQPKGKKVKFRAGDVLFISNPAGQGLAIQLATKSKYTHVGIVLPDANGKLVVYHAVEPVKKSGIAEFIAYSADGKYEHMRFRDTMLLSRETTAQLVTEANKLLGKHYDMAFSWSDNEIYCSEFVWKIYRRTFNLELCPLKKLGDFDLNPPAVQKAVKERYGDNIPLDEKVVSPGDLYNSSWFEKMN